MARNGINSLILQNRLVSQARSRSRSQSASTGAIRQSAARNNKDALSNAIKKQAGAQKNKTLSKADIQSKENYTSMKSAAESLKKRAKNLLSMPEKDWEKLTEEESAKYKEDVLAELSGIIEDYNEVMKRMTAESGSVNDI